MTDGASISIRREAAAHERSASSPKVIVSPRTVIAARSGNPEYDMSSKRPRYTSDPQSEEGRGLALFTASACPSMARAPSPAFVQSTSIVAASST